MYVDAEFRRNCFAAQLALGWMFNVRPSVVPAITAANPIYLQAMIERAIREQTRLNARHALN